MRWFEDLILTEKLGVLIQLSIYLSVIIFIGSAILGQNGGLSPMSLEQQFGEIRYLWGR